MAKTLNASAPEYHPIPAGITPSNTDVFHHHHHNPIPLPTHLSNPISLLVPYFVTERFPHPCDASWTPAGPYFETYPILSSPADFRPKSEYVRCFSGGRGYSGTGKRRREFAKIEWNKTKIGERSLALCGLRNQETNNRHQVMRLEAADKKTTIMIRNINYGFRQEDLIGLVDRFCANNNAAKGKNDEICSYDFLYLPIDFRTEKSRGFAFVNFTNAAAALKFRDAFDDFKWDLTEDSKWLKKLQVVSAKFQGKEALESHFSGSIFNCRKKEFLPVCFNPARDGAGFEFKRKYIGKRANSTYRG